MKTINNIAVLLVIFSLLFIGCGQGQTIAPEKRIYWLEKVIDSSGWPIIGTGETLYSADLDLKDVEKELYFQNPDPKSDYILESSCKFDRSCFVSCFNKMTSMSKDKKFIFYSAMYGKMFINPELIIDRMEVGYITVTEYSVYEPAKQEFHFIGALCQYSFGGDKYGMERIKEIGHRYYPISWLDEELLLLESTSDKRIYVEDQDNSLRVDEPYSIEVPYATVKAVSFSLKNFKLSPTDRFKPLKPWVAYSDANTGIVGYFDPFYPFHKSPYLEYPIYPPFSRSTVTNLTDLGCTKTYDLFELAKKVLPQDYILGDSTFCGAAIDQEYRKMCYYYITGYPKEILNYERDYTKSMKYPPIPENVGVVFGLDFDTGKIEKYMDIDTIKERARKYLEISNFDNEEVSLKFTTFDGLAKETGLIILFTYSTSTNRESFDLMLYGPKLDQIKKIDIPDMFDVGYKAIR